jgi:hypothetical protein
MIDDVASFAQCGPQSIVTNAIINAKIESKKIEFGPTKCFNIHVGTNKVCSDNLKVHTNKIIRKEFETYLGDVFCATGSNKKNIENRTNRGIGLSVKFFPHSVKCLWVIFILRLLWCSETAC